MNKNTWPPIHLLTKLEPRKYDPSEVVPLTDSDPLTWSRVDDGCQSAQWAFQAFWYLFAVTGRKEFFEHAANVAMRCPAERRSFAFSVKIYSPLPDHQRYEKLHQNPTGIDLWFDLLDKLPTFGLLEKHMIKQSGAVPHFNPQLFPERRLGETETLTKALLESSPWPEATWITVRREGDACKVCVHSETNGKKRSLPEFRTDYGGVQRIVVLPNGTPIRSFVAPPGPQTYG